MNTQTEFDSESPIQACPCGCRGNTAMHEAFESGLAGEIGRQRAVPPRASSRPDGARPTTPRPRPRPGRRGPGRVYIREPYPAAYPDEPEPAPKPSQEPGSEYNRWVQDCLNRIFNLSLPVNGILDAPSRSAIRRLQRQEGQPVTAIVSPATEGALRRRCGERSEPVEQEWEEEWGESEWEWERRQAPPIAMNSSFEIEPFKFETEILTEMNWAAEPPGYGTGFAATMRSAPWAGLRDGGAPALNAMLPRRHADVLSEAEALALVDELFEIENEEDLDLFLGKLVKRVGRAASGAVRAVGKVARSVPLGKIADVAFKAARGDLAGIVLPLLPASIQKTVRAFTTDPFSRFALQTTRAALRGENVLRAAQVAAKSGIGDLRERMRFAAMVAPFVPGIGSGVAAALGAASALAAGEPISKALISAARSAVPGGAIAQTAFDLGVNLARGKSLSEAALATARNQIPGGPAAKAAFDTAVALGQGKKIQDAAFAAAGGVLPKSPFAANALSFARRVAAGEDIRKAALSTAGNAAVKRLERQGLNVLGAAQRRAPGRKLRRP